MARAKAKRGPGRQKTPDEERLGSFFPSCPECGARMRLRAGPYGHFFGCEWFPACRGKAQLPGGWEERI